MRENRAGENAGAVIVVLASIEPEYVVVGAMLIVMFEEVVRLWRPFDQLAPLELVQFMTDRACVLRVRSQQEQDVMKEVVSGKNSNNDHPHQHDYRSDLHR